MPTYKVIFAFTQKKQGWSEVYYKDSAALNLEQIRDQVVPLAQKRAALCGQETFLDAIRISREGVANDSVLAYTPFSGLSTEESSPPDDALLVRMGNADNTRHRQMFLRGIYDGLGTKGGSFNNQYPAFIENWPNYVAALELGAYVWPSVDPATKNRQDLTGYTSDQVERVTFTTVAPVFPAPKVGQTVRVRVSGINGGSVLNGSLLVKVLTTSTAQTIQPYATFAYRFGGKLLYSEQTFAAVANVRPQKIVSRQVGAPLLASRGRLPARSRG